ncbi:MAG: ATP-binding protein [Spirochaetes bacterium]|nr:ATP-binding protein [Spirochaetota bacterium]
MLFAREINNVKKETDVNMIIQDSLIFFESKCKKNNIDLVFNLDKKLSIIHADSSQITQVIINLVVNSIQSMTEGGTLAISTKCLTNSIILEVKDTGIGIPVELNNKIFLPFFTTKDIDEGTGLGLSVVHGIIKAHKGEISFKSSLGKGTTFTIKLPIGE